MQFESTIMHAGYGYGCYIPIPEAVALEAKEKYGKRVIARFPGKVEIHCAIQRSKKAGYFIGASKNTLKKIDADQGDQVVVELLKDDSPYQAPVPEELMAVLNSDPEGMARFEALTPGKQRSIIHHINSAKHVDTRINRALKVAENLRMGAKSLKELMR